MKKRLSLGILLFISFLMSLTITGCLGPSKMTTLELTKHTGNSTVALVLYREDPTLDVGTIAPFCSGVWVDDTHVLTAYHCVKSAQRVMQKEQRAREDARPPCEGLAALFGICDPDEEVEHKTIELMNLPVHVIQQNEVDQMGKEPTAWHLTRVVSWDADHDLALLDAVGKAIPAHEVAQLADKVPEVGEPVMVVGHPRGFYWTYLTGTVAGYRDSVPGTNRGPLLQLQTPIYFGNSGGGAFDQYGHLIGIADLLPSLPAEGLFIPVESIRTFLKEAKSLETLEVLQLGK